MLNIKEHVFIERWLQRDWIVEFLGDTTSGSVFLIIKGKKKNWIVIYLCVCYNKRRKDMGQFKPLFETALAVDVAKALPAAVAVVAFFW